MSMLNIINTIASHAGCRNKSGKKVKFVNMLKFHPHYAECENL